MPRVSSGQDCPGIFSSPLLLSGPIYSTKLGREQKAKSFPSPTTRSLILCDSHVVHSGKAALENQRTTVNLPAGAGYLMFC